MWRVWYGWRRMTVGPFGVNVRQPPTARAVDEVDPLA